MKRLHSTVSYLPFDQDFFDQIKKAKNVNSKINYFDSENKVMDAEGILTDSISPDNFSHFVVLDNKLAIRADRIITLNGKPGPAFDEYDLFALQCLTCMGGM